MRKTGQTIPNKPTQIDPKKVMDEVRRKDALARKNGASNKASEPSETITESQNFQFRSASSDYG